MITALQIYLAIGVMWSFFDAGRIAMLLLTADINKYGTPGREQDAVMLLAKTIAVQSILPRHLAGAATVAAILIMYVLVAFLWPWYAGVRLRYWQSRGWQ